MEFFIGWPATILGVSAFALVGYIGYRIFYKWQKDIERREIDLQKRREAIELRRKKLSEQQLREDIKWFMEHPDTDKLSDEEFFEKFGSLLSRMYELSELPEIKVQEN